MVKDSVAQFNMRNSKAFVADDPLRYVRLQAV